MNEQILTFAILSLLIGLTNCYCPSECSKMCDSKNSSITFKCVHCLQKYFRVFNSTTGDCECMDTFREMLPPKDKCCPKNCTICAQYGCAKCKRNWAIHESALINKLGVQVCVCSDNYEYFESVKDCFCKGIRHFMDYTYLWIDNICQKCPVGCACDEMGCLHCGQQTNRYQYVDQTNYFQHVCPCKYPFVDRNGVCICIKGCSCTNGTIWCDKKQTHRYLDEKTQNYQCVTPYVDVDGECVCKDNYIQIQMYENLSLTACVCRSRIQPTQYYLFAGQCRKCPEDCTCNQYGCYKCKPSSQRVAHGGQCTCYPPYVEDSYGSCLCLQPFYLDDTGACVCLNVLYPLNFTLVGGVCYACPEDCQCDETGCYFCIDYREIIQFDDGRWSCQKCQPKAFLIDGLCRCQSFEENQCSCQSPSYMNENGICQNCPKDCSCTQQGCISCDTITNRQVTYEQTGAYTCPCKVGTSIGYSGYCVCQTTYDGYTTDCPCIGDTNTIDGVCQCQSTTDSALYYYDNLNHLCYPCPVGCTCNDTGCYDCEPDSLRWNYINLTTNLSQCPCIQTALMYKGECIQCPLGQYFTSGGCIACQDCPTCNKLGCKTCIEGMHLIDFKCVCNDPTTQNINGKCTCPTGSYQLNVKKISCNPCPKNCKECILLYSNIIGCTVCPLSQSRFNDHYNNCPCKQYYKESAHLEQYCCPLQCGSCNQFGCTSCAPSTFRFLNGEKCSCINNLYEQTLDNGTIICGCSSSQYLVIDACHGCPASCKTCFYNYTTKLTNCLSCRQNTYRNTSDNCSCLHTYIETNPIQQYCYPFYCKNLTTQKNDTTNRTILTCNQCIEHMQPFGDMSNCECIQGYFMNQNGFCAKCTMIGCKNCSSINICNYCDKYKGYYLTGSTCKHDLNASDYIYSQSQTGIIVQFKSEIVNLLYVQGELQKVKTVLDPNELIEKPIRLKTINYSLQKPSIIFAHFSHPDPNVSYFNHTLALTYQYKQRRQLQSSNTTTVVSNEKTVYIRRPIFYSQSKTKVNDRGQYQVELAMTVVVMVFCLAMYLKGFKHNQIPFFLQTLAFIGYIIQDEKFNIATYLYNLRWSYYDFGNALSGIIPDYYLQTAKGNFPFFTIDSNIFRVCGTTLLIAVINLGAVVVLRSFYFLLNNTPLRNCTRLTQTVRLNKKPIYRIIEFFYKTTMYPLLFFTFITYHHWDANILVAKSGYHNFCHILAIALVIIYFFVTMWQFYIEVISKLNKVQDASEFVFAVLGAMIVTISTHKKSYVALVAVFIGKGLVYLVSRRFLLRDFKSIEYLKILSVVFQVTTILVLIADSPAAAVVLTILTIIVQYCHEVAIVFLTDNEARLAKIKQESNVNVRTSKITETSITAPND